MLNELFFFPWIESLRFLELYRLHSLTPPHQNQQETNNLLI